MASISKILFFDIETEPNLAYVWGKYQQDVLAYKKEGEVICFSWKWNHEQAVRVASLRTHTPKQLAQSLWNLFNEADVIVAHNGKRFDVKKSNAFFIKYGLTPPKPYKVVDTKIEAKKYFMFNSNKLDDLGNFFGLGRKLQTGGFQLWLDCLAGKKAAWLRMEKYNKQDVVLLEKVYYKLLGWMNHPPVSLTGCPNCGGSHTQKRGFERKGTKYLIRRHQCQECGKWFYGEKLPIK